MSDFFAVEFQTPEGESIYFEWNPESVKNLDGELTGPTPWQLDGELDWDEIDLIRVLSARFDDGRLLGVAALRPAGAEGHGDDLVVAAMANAEEEVEPVDEALLSVEYDGSGAPRRVQLELHRDEGSMVLRVAGDVTSVVDKPDGQLELTSAALAVRLSGVAGHGRFDFLRPTA
jgi:hypothetical protein